MGSSPAGRANPHPTRVSAIPPFVESAEKADAHLLAGAVEAFLLGKRLAGCTKGTLDTYAWWLHRLRAEVSDVTALSVRNFFARLQERGLRPAVSTRPTEPSRTFFRWCVETEVLGENPLRGFSMRVPRTLPGVPTEDELRAVLRACLDTPEGTSNRTMLLVMADAGLRANSSTCWSRTGGPTTAGCSFAAGGAGGTAWRLSRHLPRWRCGPGWRATPAAPENSFFVDARA